MLMIFNFSVIVILRGEILNIGVLLVMERFVILVLRVVLVLANLVVLSVRCCVLVVLMLFGLSMCCVPDGLVVMSLVFAFTVTVLEMMLFDLLVLGVSVVAIMMGCFVLAIISVTDSLELVLRVVVRVS